MGAVKRAYYLMLASADRLQLLELAQRIGLQIIPNRPYLSPKVEVAPTPEDALSFFADSYFLTKPEWQHGEFILDHIRSGHRKNTYSIKPNLNFVGVEVYLPDEKYVDGLLRAGSGSIILRDKLFSSKSDLKIEEFSNLRSIYESIIREIIRNGSLKTITGQEYILMQNCERYIKSGRLRPAFYYQDKYFSEYM